MAGHARGKPEEPSIRFLGGAGTVTGSKHLVEYDDRRILLDCGLFQGKKELRLRNWRNPGFDPASIDAVVLSHGHLDHSGYLPILVRNGFSGRIHCTPGTADLLDIVLADAARLQEEDAARANRHGYSKHKPALPLFTSEDVAAALRLVQVHSYRERFDVAPGASVLLRPAGHILGSATVELDVGSTKVVFTGDLGRYGRPILHDPEPIPGADVLLVESTYGNRLHEKNVEERLTRVINEAAERGGALIVPAFAIGRTQELIWTIRKLEESGRLPPLTVFVDTPMGASVTEVYIRHPEDHDLEMATLLDQDRCPLSSRHYRVVRTRDESKALNAHQEFIVIIAGSGMATGGRVLHHLKQRLPDERTTVLLVGYQAEGTRGWSLLNGAKELRMFGEQVPVRAHIEAIDGLSAHADQEEILKFLSGMKRRPRRTFVVHGESQAAQALARALEARLGFRNVAIARDGEKVRLDR